MITAILQVTETYLGHDYSGWLYILPVLMDLAIITRIWDGTK